MKITLGKHVWHPAKTLSFLFTVLVCATLLWIFISWIEITSKNTAPNPQYWYNNFFIWLLRLSGR